MHTPSPTGALRLLCTAVAALGLLAAGSAAAGPANGQRPGKPRWESKQVQQQRTPTGHERNTTWTGANGKIATRDAVVTNDRANGVRTREVTATGPNGKTGTRVDTTTRTDDGYNRSSVITGPDGKTATRDADVSFDKDAGTRTREVTTTGPNGAVRTVDDVTTRTDGGYNRETVVTNPNGGTVTREATGSYDAETKTWTKSVSVDRDPPPQD